MNVTTSLLALGFVLLISLCVNLRDDSNLGGGILVLALVAAVCRRSSTETRTIGLAIVYTLPVFPAIPLVAWAVLAFTISRTITPLALNYHVKHELLFGVHFLLLVLLFVLSPAAPSFTPLLHTGLILALLCVQFVSPDHPLVVQMYHAVWMTLARLREAMKSDAVRYREQSEALWLKLLSAGQVEHWQSPQPDNITDIGLLPHVQVQLRLAVGEYYICINDVGGKQLFRSDLKDTSKCSHLSWPIQYKILPMRFSVTLWHYYRLLKDVSVANETVERNLMLPLTHAKVPTGSSKFLFTVFSNPFFSADDQYGPNLRRKLLSTNQQPSSAATPTAASTAPALSHKASLTQPATAQQAHSVTLQPQQQSYQQPQQQSYQDQARSEDDKLLDAFAESLLRLKAQGEAIGKEIGQSERQLDRLHMQLGATTTTTTAAMNSNESAEFVDDADEDAELLLKSSEPRFAQPQVRQRTARRTNPADMT